MKTQLIRNHSTLRLVGNSDNQNPIVMHPGEDGKRAVLPPGVALNTTGIPLETLIQNGALVMPCPCLATFSGVASNRDNGANPFRLFVVNTRNGEGETGVSAGGDDSHRAQAKAGPFTLQVETGDVVAFQVANDGAEDMALWPNPDAYALEVKFQNLEA